MKTFFPSVLRRQLPTASAATAARAAGAYASRMLLGLLTLGGALAAAPVQAAPGQSVQPVALERVDAVSFRVRISNPAAQQGQVQVLSLASGKTLFSENYAAPAYGHRFNFGVLPAGRYAIVVKAGEQQYRYTLQLQADGQYRTVAMRSMRARLGKASLGSLAAAPAACTVAGL
ncbi:hypothetical protein [Solirubrum puertoriconensis]|uniref:Uncharacterized protein n=1 Tax=Solirubrum puertoriconensis TaxID=1751427 RepID=A0A9X0HH81_SOLP1|nr:hypothetical protein [Solirubrum puertoriconensis]KUG05849.1 hypothetical protein ASU33_00215 [Solirubrum puertoriconensis]